MRASDAASAGGAATVGGLADNIATLADQGGASPNATPNAVTVVLNWPRMLKEK